MEANRKKTIEREVEDSGVRRRPTPPQGTTGTTGIPPLRALRGLEALEALDARDGEVARRALEARELREERLSAEMLGFDLPGPAEAGASVLELADEARVDFDHLVDVSSAPRILRSSSLAPAAPFEEVGQPFLAPAKSRVSPAMRRAGYLSALVLGAGLSWMAIGPSLETAPTIEEAPAVVAAAAATVAASAEVIAEVAPEAVAVIPEVHQPVADEEGGVNQELTAPQSREAAATPRVTTSTVTTEAPAEGEATTPEPSAPEATPVGTAAAETEAAPETEGADPLNVAPGDRALAVNTAAEPGSVLQAVDQAVGAERPEVAEAAAEPEEAAPRVTRASVSAAMNHVRDAVEACATGRHGQANVQMMVHPSGRVRGVRVVGTFAGTVQGSCIAREVRGARFPAFEGADFEVHFPFRL
ncbi:MAG: hypothetical protein JRH11_00950 [Deltaproteobacteria bacterium]|nr:hypothetical protein [Deltaproteobacteria bacterium]